MEPSRSRWRPNRMLLGMIVGWAVGMVWWTGLLMVFGPSTRISVSDGVQIEETISFGSRLKYAPVMAGPWALTGLVVGAINNWAPGARVPIFAFMGLMAGGVYGLLTRPHDGWLALTMPVDCNLGILIGALVGATSRTSTPRRAE